jgi:hypothetical protein
VAERLHGFVRASFEKGQWYSNIFSKDNSANPREVLTNRQKLIKNHFRTGHILNVFKIFW